MDTEIKYKKYADEHGYKHISNDTNIRLISNLPFKLGEWSEEPEKYVINYEYIQHGLGYSKRYNEGMRRSIWADVYVFHARQTNMTDGIKSKKFLDMWSQSIGEPSFVKTCSSKDNTDVVETFNNIKFRKCILEIAPDGKKFDGLLFMTVFDGTFLKVRISYSPDYNNADTEINEFMNDLTKHLSNEKISDHTK